MAAFKTLVLALVALSCLGLSCQAVGTGLEDLASSSSSSYGPTYQLESSPMGPIQTSRYTSILNQRLQDANLPHRANPHLLEPRRVQDLVPPTSTILNTHSTSKNLHFLDITPDGRKVHALLLPPPASPNVAIVSTPKRWTTMAQRVQLHTFANLDGAGVHEGLKDEFNSHPLEALARNALPRTHESAWRGLVGRPLR